MDVVWSVEGMVERQRNALVQMLLVLFAQAGLTSGGYAPTLPRHVRLAVLHVLRPAESATRRLIYTLARTIDVVLRPLHPKPGTRSSERKPDNTRIPAFPMIDKMKCFDPPRPKRPAGWVGPRLWVIGVTECPRTPPPPPLPMPDDPVDAAQVRRRLLALKQALEDLPGQAQRMARVMARRRLAPPGPLHVQPLRGGFPPGHRSRQRHPVDEVLADCHWLARRPPEPVDTS